MSNPAVPGPVGATGSLMVGVGLWAAGVPPTNGYWLATAAWTASAATDAAFGDTWALPESVQV